MANILFVFLFLIGIGYGFVSGNKDNILTTLLISPKNALYIFFEIYANLIFWSGILEICKESGLLYKMSNLFSILLKPFFKKLNKDSLALQYISLNLVANTLSFGNAAIPFGLKAIDELKKLNNNSEIISDEMITFLLLNVSGFTIIPTGLFTILNQFKIANLSNILVLIICFSLVTIIVSMTLNKLIIKYEKC